VTTIHPTAIVEDGAQIGSDVIIGPYSLIGPHVKLNNGVRLHGHVVIDGHTEIGAETEIFPFASLGKAPQHLARPDEPTKLMIGARNVLRESVTMSVGTEAGGGVTKVGDNGYFMAYSHVAHDCQVGDNVIFANSATLGGHAAIGDHVYIGGLAAVHQYARVGKHAIVGGMTGVEFDVIPYGSATGNRAHLIGLNLVGLKRRGYTREQIHDLRNAYRLLFAAEGTFQERLSDVAELFTQNAEVMDIVVFVRETSARGLTMPKPERTD
jgi:UDP-N-acetylglucosamine acyltransferase